jgi:hypothetical protein
MLLVSYLKWNQLPLQEDEERRRSGQSQTIESFRYIGTKGDTGI